ncbi:hypothetical protein [Haladaptatus sp. T7]|uniref:hypothetical protein n=1 Tax=Haladaptatus sp. T7 TaxID=2029368 RepID=UPI002231967D|nr:hypothetical protein [Haladaptatus sp. T7]
MANSRLSFGARLRLVIGGLLLLLVFGAFMSFGPLDSLLFGGLTAFAGVAFVVVSYKGRTIQSHL